MKKNNLTLGVFAVLLLSSTLAVAESDYPAADFQPKVLFTDDSANDTALKNKPKATAETTVKKVSASVSNTVPQSTVTTKSEESGSASLIGLLVLAAVGGFLFYNKQGGFSFGSNSPATSHFTYGKHDSGLSGVTRYIKNRELMSASGVTRYLAQQEAAVKAAVESTGVAKYVSAQVAQSSNEGSGATGVEKYLKNRA